MALELQPFSLSAEFWAHEAEAVLLKLNKGFLGPGPRAIGACARVRAIVDLMTFSDPTAAKIPVPKLSVVVDPDRILVADAERTFSSDKHRQTLIAILHNLWKEFGDYQQSMSYVTSFFLLFLPVDQVWKIMTELNHSPHFIPDHWKGRPVGMARDALVWKILLEQHNPKVADHLAELQIYPETFLQRWFSGLCIHVLEFDLLLDYMEQFAQDGIDFILRFALAFFDVFQARILASGANASVIYKLVHLDADQGITREQIDEILARAKALKSFTAKYDLEAMREAQMKVLHDTGRIQPAGAAEAAAAADEVGDCAICDDGFGDYFCSDCGCLVCEVCHEDGEGKHDPSHSIKSTMD